MKIGIIRHFKVDCHKSLFMTSKDFKTWEQNYNKSNIIRNDVDLMNIKWDKCYASTLIRAKFTAQDVYKNEIIYSDLIRETVIDPIIDLNFKLPYCFWGVGGRIAWYLNHKSQEENRKMTKEKVIKFVDLILKDMENEGHENILVITHGFFMFNLQIELKRRGFKGKLTYNPKNGHLYLYEK